MELNNPKAEGMCQMCYDKDKCNKDILDQIFCKLNQINMTLVKNAREEK